MKDLNKQTIAWAEARGFFEQPNVHAQALKYIEESGEMYTAFLSGDIAELKDAIGDRLVVLCILAKQLGLNPDSLLTVDQRFQTNSPVNFDCPELFTKFSKTVMCYESCKGELAACILKQRDCSLAIVALCGYINRFASMFNLNILDCYEYALGQIKNRTGKQVNGSYIKSEDL